jgi:hypothetical protein
MCSRPHGSVALMPLPAWARRPMRNGRQAHHF